MGVPLTRLVAEAVSSATHQHLRDASCTDAPGFWMARALPAALRGQTACSGEVADLPSREDTPFLSQTGERCLWLEGSFFSVA
jgi:hypothetical protein